MLLDYIARTETTYITCTIFGEPTKGAVNAKNYKKKTIRNVRLIF